MIVCKYMVIRSCYFPYTLMQTCSRFQWCRPAASAVLSVLYHCPHLSSAIVSVSGRSSTSITVTADAFNLKNVSCVHVVVVLMSPQVFPHRLAALLDSEISQGAKVALANLFCSLRMCCLDMFSTRLRKYMEARALIHVRQCQAAVCSNVSIQAHNPNSFIRTIQFLRQTDLGQTTWPRPRDACAKLSCSQFYEKLQRHLVLMAIYDLYSYKYIIIYNKFSYYYRL